MSYLSVEEEKTITHDAATRASMKKEKLCLVCRKDDSDELKRFSYLLPSKTMFIRHSAFLRKRTSSGVV